jgi:integrase
MMPRHKRYPGSIRQRGATWQVRLYIGGEYHTFTVRGTRVDAENFATTKAGELEGDVERQQDGMPDPVTFLELLDEYDTQELPGLTEGTQRSYRGSFDVFRLYFGQECGNPRADKVRRPTVKRFIAWRRTRRVVVTGEGDQRTVTAQQGAGVSAHTVAKDFRVLKRLMNYGIDMEYIAVNPCTRMKGPKADPRTPHILSADEYDRLIAACDGRAMVQLFVLVLGETGARSLSEALRLRWEDIDLAEGFIQIRSRAENRTKSGKSRWAPMTPRLHAAMRDHFAQYRLATYHGERSAWLFHHTGDGTRRKAGQRITNLRRAFHAARKRAGVPAIRVHDLRHRRVTTWLAEGKPAALVQEAMGHSSFQTTLGYKHLAREHLRALVAEPEKHSPEPDMAKPMAKRG